MPRPSGYRPKPAKTGEGPISNTFSEIAKKFKNNLEVKPENDSSIVFNRLREKDGLPPLSHQIKKGV